MTPAEFALMIRGYNNLNWKKWSQTRLIAYTTFAMTPRKKGKSIPSIFRWMPLPTDKQNNVNIEQSKMKAVFEALKLKNHGR